MPAAWALALVLAISVRESECRASPATETIDLEADAETLIRDAIELRKRQRDAEALEELRVAYDIHPTPRALAQMGLAEQALGQWVDAERDLQGALVDPANPWIRTHGETLLDALRYVETHLAWLEVDPSAHGAQIRVDGNVVGNAPLAAPIRVVAGTVLVSVVAGGYRTAERSVTIAAGAHRREYVELSAEPSPSMEGPLALRCPSPQARPSMTSWFALAGGALAAGFGAAYGVETFVNKSERAVHCASNGCDDQGMLLDAAARRDATISTVAFASSAALVGTAVWLFLRPQITPRSHVAIPSASACGPGAADL